MRIDWKKVLAEVLRVVIAAIAGASASGCASQPIINLW